MKKTTNKTVMDRAMDPALHARAGRVALAAAALAALAACGGGGGGGSNGSANSASAPGATPPAPAAVAVALLPPGGAAAAAFTPTGDMTNDTLAFFNARRAVAGIPAVAQQSDIAHAALNHALYNTNDNNVGHYEVAGTAGFTGVDPTSRVNLYHPSTFVGEVVSAISGGPYASSYEAADGLFDAPFHRGVILGSFASGGVGVALAPDASRLTTVVADFSDDSGALKDTQLIAWPYAGQTDAKTRWIDNESPDPLAATPQYAGKVVGYPVTLTASSASSFSNVSFALVDPTGASVPCQEVDSSSASDAAHLAMCVPFSPLKTATAYTAKVSGTLTDPNSASSPGGATRSFAVAWTFTTVATDNVPPGTRPIAPAASAGAVAKSLRAEPGQETATPALHFQ